MVFIISVSLAGCLQNQNFYKPRPAGMGGPPKDAPVNYRTGWEDGCETGMSTMVLGYYKSFYKYKIDVKMKDDPAYYKAWKDAYTYCRQYTFRYTWFALDNYTGAENNNPLCVLCPNEFGR